VAILPAPRTSGRYAISLVCLGNICRSPTAQVVLEARLAAAGLDDRVSLRSSGTGDWHVGRPMDARAAATLEDAGYDASRHRAQQYDAAWADQDDLVLVMDHDNLADLGGRTDRVAMFRDFDPAGVGQDVPDPYYGGADGFRDVLTMVERTSDALVGLLASTLD